MVRLKLDQGACRIKIQRSGPLVLFSFHTTTQHLANLYCESGHLRRVCLRDFPGGAVDKNPLANAGDTGSIPAPGRSHMPQSN